VEPRGGRRVFDDSDVDELRARNRRRDIKRLELSEPVQAPSVPDPPSAKKPRLEPFATSTPEKKIRYQIDKHSDTNRDILFIKMVAGALNRKSFQTLMVVESESVTPTDPSFDVRIKYTYNEQLLVARSVSLGVIKDMLKVGLDGSWRSSDSLHERLINNDTAISVYSRHVAHVIASEVGSLIPRTKTKFMIMDEMRISDERVLSLMRVMHSEFNVLEPSLAKLYLKALN
jgi:hypothetical protein